MRDTRGWTGCPAYSATVLSLESLSSTLSSTQPEERWLHLSQRRAYSLWKRSQSLKSSPQQLQETPLCESHVERAIPLVVSNVSTYLLFPTLLTRSHLINGFASFATTLSTYNPHLLPRPSLSFRRLLAQSLDSNTTYLHLSSSYL